MATVSCRNGPRASERRTGLEALPGLIERRHTMTTRSVVLVATLLLALPVSAQDPATLHLHDPCEGNDNE